MEAHLAMKQRMGERDGTHANRTAITSLSVLARQWSTPRASPNENRNTKAAPSHGETHGRTLAGDVLSWATPTTRDGKDGGSPSPNAPTNSLLGRQAPRTLTDGPALSLPVAWAGSRLYLNPRFVEWLMGWPDEWTGSVHVGMASYLSRQRLQLAFLLDCWDGPGGWSELIS